MKPYLLTITLFLATLLAANHLASASITINGTTTSGQTLSAAVGSLSVTSTGLLSVAGSTIDITVTGNSTITNDGTIKQTGTGRAIRDNTGGLTLTVTNNAGGLIQTADADPFQMNVAGSNVTLNNFGTIISLNASAGGAQAVDWNALTSGSNTLNNFSTGLIKAVNADAVRPGVNGFIVNSGTIMVTGTSTSNDGIDAQTNTGINFKNAATGFIEGGRHGITGGNITTGVYAMSGSNGGIVQGDDGSGINIDGLDASEVVTITNSGTITGHGVTGDGDGIDVDGILNLTNTGTIKSINAVGATSEGITVGGGTIINSGTIEGDISAGNTTAVGRGITLAGIDTSGTATHIYANTSVTNSGLIKGQSDSGIAIDGGASGFTVTITNQAGGIIEGSGTNAAIRTNGDNDTIINSGTIVANGTGKAIDLAAGNDSLQITGSSASIVGGIDGGAGSNTLTINAGTGNSFTYAGTISNFSSAEVKSGKVTLSGSSNYTGLTTVSGGKLIVSGAISGSVTTAVGATVGSGNNLTSSIGSVGLSSDATDGGTLAPGDNAGSGLSSIGKLTVTGTLGLGTAGTLGKAHLSMELGGTVAGSQYDQIATTGAVSLTNVNLDGSFVNSFASNINYGDTFFLIINGGGNTISTGFANQSALTDSNGFRTITFGSQLFEISYTANFAGGSFATGGHDVALMAVPDRAPSRFSAARAF